MDAVDIQVRSENFLAQTVNLLRSGPLCLTDEFNLPDGDRMIVSFVDVRATPWLERVSERVRLHRRDRDDFEIDGTTIYYHQPMTIQATRISSLEAAGSNASVPDQVFDIKVIFQLRMEVVSGMPQLGLRYVDVEVGALGLVPDASDRVRERFEGLNLPATPIDLSVVESMTGASVTNAAAVVDSAGGRIWIRITTNEPSDASGPWGTFFLGSVPNWVGSSGWAILIHRSTLMSAAKTRAAEALASQQQFDRAGSIDATWHSSLPGFELTIPGKLKNACPCGPVMIDLDLDVTLRSSFSAPQLGILRSTTSVDWDLNDLDVACCAATGGVVAGVVVGFLFGSVGSFIAAVGTFVSAIAFVSTYTPSDILPAPAPMCERLSEISVRCDQALQVGTGLGAMALASVSGTFLGLVLQGELGSGIVLEHANLSVWLTPFGWRLESECGGAPENHARVRMENNGRVDLEVCEARVLDDPLGIYRIANRRREVVVSPIFPLPSAFTAAPYPCKLLIKSNGGARLLTFEPPANITEVQQREFSLESRKRKLDCGMRVLPAFRGKGLLRLGVVDPLRDITDVLTHVEVVGLAAGEEVVAETDNRIVASGRAAADGRARISFLAGAKSTRAVGLRRELQGTPLATARALVVKEVQLSRRASIRVPSKASSLSMGRQREAPIAVVTTSTSVLGFSLRQPSRPVLTFLTHGRGIHGGCVQGDRVLTWGDEGLRSFPLVGAGKGYAILDEALRDVIRLSDGSFAALARDGIVRLTRDLEHAGRIDAPDLVGIVAARNCVILETHEAMECIDMISMERRSMARPTRMTERLAGSRRFGVLHYDGGEGWDIELVFEGEDLAEIARHAGRAWVRDTVAYDDLVVRITGDRCAVTVDAVRVVKQQTHEKLSDADDGPKALA